mgnify:FL=1
MRPPRPAAGVSLQTVAASRLLAVMNRLTSTTQPRALLLLSGHVDPRVWLVRHSEYTTNAHGLDSVPIALTRRGLRAYSFPVIPSEPARRASRRGTRPGEGASGVRQSIRTAAGDSAPCGRATSDDFAARPSHPCCTLGRKHRRRWQPRGAPRENRRVEAAAGPPTEKPQAPCALWHAPSTCRRAAPARVHNIPTRGATRVFSRSGALRGLRAYRDGGKVNGGGRVCG